MSSGIGLQTQPLTEAERIEWARIRYELELRRKIHPIEFFKPLPVQQRFRQDQARIKVGFGGNRSSKTTMVAWDLLETIKASATKLKIWICGETYQDSVAIQQKKIWDLCPKDEISYGKYDEINGFTNRKLQFKRGDIITFKSYDQGRESFQSDDIDIIWNDEEPPAEIVREQKMRLLDRRGKMIISMTSLKGVTDLIADIFEDHEVLEEQMSAMLTDNKMLPRVAQKDGIKFYFLWTEENPYISQETVKEEAKLMTDEEKTSRLYGLPINLTGKIYNFNRAVHTIAWEDLPQGPFCLYHILDPHDRKPWAMAWVAVHKTGHCYVVDEYPFGRNFNEMLSDDKSYKEYVDVIRQKEAILADHFGPVMKRIIDPNFGEKTERMAERVEGSPRTTPKITLQKYGLRFVDAVDSVEAGHLKVREFLYYQIKDSELVASPMLQVVDDCQNTIRHLSRYSRKDINGVDGDIKDKVQPQEKYKDYSDLVRYFCMSGARYFEPKKQLMEVDKVY